MLRQQAGDAIVKSKKKRTLEQLKATDAPGTIEDEQHSCQSAFLQYQPQSVQPSACQIQKMPYSSVVQTLMDAAQSHDGAHRTSSSHELHTEVNGPSHLHASAVTKLTGQHQTLPDLARADQPSQRDNMQAQPWPSTLTMHSPLPMPQHSTISSASRADAMYAQTKPKSKISPHFVKDIQRLERPEMDADSVQAALEFAEAVQISPAQQAQQASDDTPAAYAQQHSTDYARLLQTLEIGTSRLDVLRILIHRICSSTSSNFSRASGGGGQLLEVVSDLLKDMESNQWLLHHAEQAVSGHMQAAIQRVDTLQAHHAATREFWLQSQRLQTLSSDRQAVLQKMMM